MNTAVPHLHAGPSSPNHWECADRKWGEVGGGGVSLGWRCGRSKLAVNREQSPKPDGRGAAKGRKGGGWQKGGLGLAAPPFYGVKCSGRRRGASKHLSTRTDLRISHSPRPPSLSFAKVGSGRLRRPGPPFYGVKCSGRRVGASKHLSTRGRSERAGWQKGSGLRPPPKPVQKSHFFHSHIAPPTPSHGK